ncbi:MAG: PLP-dependent aminotransferase family protein [Alphaproteobacteria bacterium]|nr:PLP-dependent aminotransferase family protein [Alphaproteobacteria bacterium]
MHDPLSGVIDLDPRSGKTLVQQLCDRLREAILAGHLQPGQHLPSSRQLARRLKVSRNTVSFAVEQLAMEGYFHVAQGRRPTVAAVARSSPASGAPLHRASRAIQVSRWAERLSRSDWPFEQEGAPRPFSPGLADAREFPHDLWARCLRRAARNADRASMVGVNRPGLRVALLRHLAEHRGVKAAAHQLVITPSAQSAIELIARTIVDQGDTAWLESPGYGGARAAFEAVGARILGVGLDDRGLSIAKRIDRPRLIFVTPSHQYPTGRLMPVSRRQELLGFAASAGAVIIEDDYDSEFHYDGRPVASLQGLDRGNTVFYVGTLSKSTFADIRVGYAIVPESLVTIFERAQRHGGQIVAASVQDALADFINEGYLAQHIRKMVRLYRARRDRLVQTLKAAAGDRLEVMPPAGGMQLLAYLRAHDDDRTITTRLAEAGVTVRPLSRHFVGEAAGQGLFLGFAAWNEREIDAGADVIGRIISTPADAASKRSSRPVPAGRVGKAPSRRSRRRSNRHAGA